MKVIFHCKVMETNIIFTPALHESKTVYPDWFALLQLDAKLMGLQLLKATHLPPFSID